MSCTYQPLKFACLDDWSVPLYQGYHVWWQICRVEWSMCIGPLSSLDVEHWAHQTCGCIQCVYHCLLWGKAVYMYTVSLSVYFMLPVSIPVRLVHSVAITSKISCLLFVTHHRKGKPLLLLFENEESISFFSSGNPYMVQISYSKHLMGHSQVYSGPLTFKAQQFSI